MGVLERIIFFIVASAAGFEYYVSRTNGSGGLCATNEKKFIKSDLFPIYNLSTHQLLSVFEKVKPVVDDVSAWLETESCWTDAWRMENVTVTEAYNNWIIGHDYRTTVAIAEQVRMLRGGPLESGSIMHILAANLTFILTAGEDWRGGSGVKVYLDHINKRTAKTYTWAASCEFMDTAEERCTELTIIKKVRSDLLWGGKNWRRLRILALNSTLELKGSTIVFGNWKMSNIFLKNVFVRSHSQPSVYRTPLFAVAEPNQNAATNRLERTIIVGREARICLKLFTSPATSPDGVWGSFSVFNSGGRKVREGSLVAENKNGTWQTQLDAILETSGNVFVVQLHNVALKIFRINDCPEFVMDVFKSAIGCTVYRGSRFKQPDIFRTLPEDLMLNDSMKVPLSLFELQSLCNDLGIPIEDPFEKISLCGRQGCKLLRCP